ncbi:MAG: TIGR04282 family arsenosugar biosynthesis glycosyltransferase [Desulfuromonadales bacterium]|nr:TIGR04282 family arsenosugar biosynthesis glycosyltransferase [Desulfuromonadales bacterium]
MNIPPSFPLYSQPIVVALFVRVPIPGRVKTRLAVNLGNEGACHLYRAMVNDILHNIKACGYSIYLFHDGDDQSELPDNWRQAADGIVAQRGENIGERMSAAFEHCFANKVEKVILIGSDIPGLDSSIIISASVALQNHDAVFAPAADGGYCLIGLQQGAYHPALFQDIPWSTEQVLRTTLEKCEVSCLRVTLLKVLQDIDTICDLKAYCQNIFGPAIATNRYLTSAGFL